MDMVTASLVFAMTAFVFALTLAIEPSWPKMALQGAGRFIRKNLLTLILLGMASAVLYGSWELTRATFTMKLSHFRFLVSALVLPLALLCQRYGTWWKVRLAGTTISLVCCIFIIEAAIEILVTPNERWIIIQMLAPHPGDDGGSAPTLFYLLYLVFGTFVALYAGWKGSFHLFRSLEHDTPKLRNHRLPS